MKIANQILSVLMGIIFIVSSTGVLVYKINCSCTGDEQVGIYLKPETCEKNFHVHHAHDNSGTEIETNESCCHECTPLTHDCGCNVPEVSFFKLMNEISNDEIAYLNTPTFKITSLILTQLIEISETTESDERIEFYTDPPPKISSSKSFLIQIHQLKIPFIA